MNNRSQFKTLVILDLETTGLVYDEPKITELAMIAVHISTLDEMKADEELPRILNKFVKFFNPGKAIRAKATDLTDLDNHMLINYAPFSDETIVAIERFLDGFQKPLCFVAHNGNIFDFPILLHEIQSALHTKENIASNPTNHLSLTSIACADSMHFFREIYKLLNDKDAVNDKSAATSSASAVPSIHHGYVEIPLKSELTQPKSSVKLVKIYEREFNRLSDLKSHRAEDDCLMLLAILKRYLPDWLEWVNIHHRLLKDFSALPTITVTTAPKKFSPKNNVHVKRPLKF